MLVEGIGIIAGTVATEAAITGLLVAGVVTGPIGLCVAGAVFVIGGISLGIYKLLKKDFYCKVKLIQNIGKASPMETVKRISSRGMPKLHKNLRIYSLHKIISMDRKRLGIKDK